MTEQLEHPDRTSQGVQRDRTGKRRERRDAAENRKRVLDVAERLFAQSGVEAVSMNQIAQAAGVGQATLYRRYAHKGELCMDLLRESFEPFRDEVEAYLAGSEGEAPALERLIGVVARFVTLKEEKGPLLAAIDDASSGKRRCAQFRAPGYQWMHGTIAGLLGEAVANGELRAVDVTFTADALLAALGPDIYQFQRQERGLTPEQIVEGVTRMFTESRSGLPASDR